ncbi:MAG: sodium-dependent transporter [Acidobacteriota bacterium]
MSAPGSGRGQWSSQVGFVLAAAGSAVGLGNIWRFPYSAGQNGGGAFVLVYLLCVLGLGLPVMLLEISLGRATQKNPVGAIRAVRPHGPWKGLGYLAIITGLGILSFYAVIAGQVVAYFVDYAQRVVTDQSIFSAYNGWESVVFFAVFLVLTVLVVVGGVQRGIERWSKILMPLLLILMLGIILRGIFLPGAGEGLRWLLMPDFSKLNLHVVLEAMAQAFFSLSLGMGAMLTYGSYLSKKQDIFHCGTWVVFFDTLVAVLAGLMIFPAVFALGQQPDAGPNLIFKVLPAVFAGMTGGNLVGAVFFFLLSLAALTSTVSLLEVISAYCIDERGWSRARTVWIAAGTTLLVGVPSALAWVGASPWATMRILGREGFFSLMDFAWVNLSLPFGALMLCIFATYVWGLDQAASEILSSSPGFRVLARPWRFFIRWVCPIFIAVILASQLGAF